MANVSVAAKFLPPEVCRAILETTGIGYCLIQGGQIHFVNQAWVAITGYLPEELPVRNLWQFFGEHPEGAEQLRMARLGQTPRTGFEIEITAKDTGRKWVAVTLTPLGDLSSADLLVTVCDITAYKERQEALRQSELRYRTVFEMAPDMFIIYDTNGVVLDQNQGAGELLGVSKEEAALKEGMLSNLCEEDKARFPQIREETLKHGAWRGELRAVRDRGQGPEIISFDSFVRVADLGGEKIVICNARDITERKKMEHQIRKALREKETLLREIHHRVKNNMQIISTLIKLQARHAPDEQTRAIFRETENRILSMAMIHEKLYQTEGLHRIDLKDYIDDLVQEVVASFGDLADGIIVKTDFADVALGLDTAIPCGLIIIELTSNALKYAFPTAGGRREILIGFHHQSNDFFELTVSDNGIGLPAEIDLPALKSLGLRLVADLARYQLDGEMSLDRGKGTSIHVKFREKKKSTPSAHNG